MIRLSQSQNVKGMSGDPLPDVYSALAQKGFQFVRGQLVLVSAPPGSGKSAFVLTMALRAGLPTFYFSADSDAFTQLTRAIAITDNLTMEQARAAVRSGDAAASLIDRRIWFSYDASPSLADIERELDGFFEVFEDYPALIVVDNVGNVVPPDESGEGFAALGDLMEFLHGMARDTGACVVGLHHVTGAYNDSDQPIPMSGVKGQIAGVPEAVLTLHRRKAQTEFQSDTLCVSVVKNRGGPMDPSGRDYAELMFNGDRMEIRDFPA